VLKDLQDKCNDLREGGERVKRVRDVYMRHVLEGSGVDKRIERCTIGMGISGMAGPQNCSFERTLQDATTKRLVFWIMCAASLGRGWRDAENIRPKPGILVCKGMAKSKSVGTRWI